MPLESVFLEFLNEGGLFGTGYPVMMRNINWRLRLKEDMTKYPPEFMKMWADFFSLLGNQGQMTSDKLMAAAQKMFEIEQYIKTVPVTYGKANTYEIIQSLSAQLDKSTEEAYYNFKDDTYSGLTVFHPKKGKK